MIRIKKTDILSTTGCILTVMRFPDNIPPEQLSMHASDNMLLFTAVLGILIGCTLTWLGKKGKQLWIFSWGIGLVICSIAFGIAIFYGV